MKSAQSELSAIRDWDRSGPNDSHNTKPESPQQSYRVTCSAFRVFASNTLQGFVTLRLEPPGMEIHGCTAHSKNNKRWVNLPSKQYTNQNGVICWQNLVTVDEGRAFWRFQELACEAIDAFLEKQGIAILKEGIDLQHVAPEPKEGGHEFPF